MPQQQQPPANVKPKTVPDTHAVSRGADHFVLVNQESGREVGRALNYEQALKEQARLNALAALEKL